MRGPELRKQYLYPRRETETGRVIKGEKSEHLTLVQDRKLRRWKKTKTPTIYNVAEKLRKSWTKKGHWIRPVVLNPC